MFYNIYYQFNGYITWECAYGEDNLDKLVEEIKNKGGVIVSITKQ